ALGAFQYHYLRGDQTDQLFGRVATYGAPAPFQSAWYLTDRMQSVIDVASLTGGVLKAIRYDNFGRAIGDGAGVIDEWGYTGRPVDSWTGVQNNRARWYDPRIGRWITTDPLGYAAGDANLYRYVNGNPLNHKDPSGMFLGAIAGAVVGAVV